MNTIKVNAKEFKKALNRHKAGTSGKVTMPILGCVILEARSIGLTLDSYDLLTKVWSHCPTIQGSGTINPACVEFRSLARAIKASKGEIEISCSPNDQTITIDGSRLATVSCEEFPEFYRSEEAPIETLTLSGVEIATLIKAASKDESRINLCGIYVRRQQLESTDGHRIAAITLDKANDIGIANKIVPTSLFDGISGLETVTLHLSKDACWLTNSDYNWSAISRYVDADAPDTAGVYSSLKAGARMTCNQSDLEFLLLKSLVDKRDLAQNVVGITFGADGLIKVERSGEESSYKGRCNSLKGGNDQTIGLNAAYVLDAISGLSGTLHLEIRGVNEPVTIADSEGKVNSLIMPAKLA